MLSLVHRDYTCICQIENFTAGLRKPSRHQTIDTTLNQAVILIQECPVMNISYVSSEPLPSQVPRSHRLHRLTGVGKDPQWKAS